MQKGLKITLIVVGVLVGIIALDTLQAKIFNNSPLLKIRQNLDEGSLDYIDEGLFVNHYHCNNNEKVTTLKGTKFACSEIKQTQKFSKVVQNIFIEFDFLNDWHYEEVKNEKEEFELKIYKNSLERYATLKVSNNPLGVCGTGLTKDVLSLNSGRYAEIGLYEEDKTWSYISFPFVNYVSILNTSLNEDESSEILEIIKTIRVFEDNGIDFYLTKPESHTDIRFNLYASNSFQKVYLAGNIGEFYVVHDGVLTLKEYMERESPSSFDSIRNITNQLTIYGTLNDGGTTIYKSKDKDMTIITCNKLNGNKNIYIGDYSLELEDEMCR